MELFPSKKCYGVFEFPLLRNAQKSHKKNQSLCLDLPTSFSGYLLDIRRFPKKSLSAPRDE
jgi:hypothetical protein